MSMKALVPSRGAHVHSRRPVQRGTLAEHLYRAVAKPKSGEQRRLRNALGKGLRYAVGGAVFYFGVALLLGGRDRVREDFEKLQVEPRAWLCQPALVDARDARVVHADTSMPAVVTAASCPDARMLVSMPARVVYTQRFCCRQIAFSLFDFQVKAED